MQYSNNNVCCAWTDPRHLRRSIEFYSDVPVILNDTHCYSSSERLTDCTRGGYGHFPNCSHIAVAYCEGECQSLQVHTRHISITHTAREPCSDPEAIRLTQYISDTFGRLEVCSGGYWGSVCGIGATDTIAAVACGQLNHAPKGTYNPYYMHV